jgi:hypothetical protein
MAIAASLGRFLLNGLLSGTGGGQVRDYAHGAKTFRPNNFANSPRTKYLFHVFFNINPNTNVDLPVELFSYLVKNIELPKYQVEVKEQNQYNRKKLVQTRIRYQPISIAFHDDNAGNIREFWRSYYNFYYGDGRYTENDYVLNKTYDATKRGKWGYDPEENIDFLTSIEIHSFHGGQDQKITLINPVISGFSHDSHDYAEGNGVMQQTMQITYTAVKYNQGYWTGAPGFGDPRFYDTTPSNLSGSFAGYSLDNQGNPFFPGSTYIDPYGVRRDRNTAIYQQNFAYDNLNKFNAVASNDIVNDATLATINSNNNRYVFPTMNIAQLQTATSNPIVNTTIAATEGNILGDDRRFYGIFSDNSWQKTLEDQGYDPRQIVEVEGVVGQAISQGYVTNNAEALILATDYFNNPNDTNELLKSINATAQVFNAPDATEATYKAVNWQQELRSKGYVESDINYANSILQMMNLNLENESKLTAVAEDIIKRKSYYNVMY